MKRRTLLTLLLLTFGIAADAQNDEGGNPYLAHIGRFGREPMEYMADKIRTYPVVALGEDHWVKDHPQFLCELLAAMARDTTANIDVLALEFGNHADQRTVNELLASPEYREDLAFKILQHAPDIYGNPYKEYAEVFRTVWQTNRDKPEAYRTRILLLDPAYIQRHFDNEEYVYTCSRDDNMFSLIRDCILQRRHVVFYAGTAHTQAQIRGVRDNDYYYNFPSAGYLLKKSYPRDVFIINLWGAYMGAGGYEPDDRTVWVEIAGGILDEAFRLNGNKPVAFDLGAAFPALTAAEYYGNPNGKSNWSDHPTDGSPYTRDLLMRDRCDGIVFIKPVAEFSGAHLIDIYDGDFLKRIEKRSEGECKSAEQVFRQLKEWHPILDY